MQVCFVLLLHTLTRQDNLLFVFQMKSPSYSLQLSQHRLRWKEGIIKELVAEVVKIEEGEASLFYFMLIKFSQTDQPDSREFIAAWNC